VPAQNRIRSHFTSVLHGVGSAGDSQRLHVAGNGLRLLTSGCAKYVLIGGGKYSVKTTAKRGFKQVDFRFEDHELRGLEQNPDTKSRWAKMAREGKKVMQFLEAGRYVAVVVEGRQG